MALNMYLLEGQQAEEYKIRKAKEKNDADLAYVNKYRGDRGGSRKIAVDSLDPERRKNYNFKNSKDVKEYEAKERAAKAVNYEYYHNRFNDNYKNIIPSSFQANAAGDAYYRHERRHANKKTSKNESAIFADIDII